VRYDGELEGVKTRPRVPFGRENYYVVGNHCVGDKWYSIPAEPAFAYATISHETDKACEEALSEWIER